MSEAPWYVRSGEPVSAAIGDELALLSVDLGKYFLFNESAAAVWELLAEPATEERLCEQLVLRFEVHGDRCRSDVRELLSRLMKAGLVSVVERPDPGAAALGTGDL